MGVLGSVIVYPMMNIDKFKKNQEWRKGLDQEKLQPGGYPLVFPSLILTSMGLSRDEKGVQG